MNTFLSTALSLSYKLNPLIGMRLKSGLTIFVYHDVTDQPSQFARDHGLSVTPSLFRMQATWIQENFQVIHPRDLLKAKELPERAAIITFDDGFLGSFDNGLSILNELGLPSLFFLNMKSILDGTPLISSIASFLNEQAAAVDKKNDYHLHLTPSILDKLGLGDYAEILEYQGPFATRETLRDWENSDLVSFGNHFYDHFNAAALTRSELEGQYKLNQQALSELKNAINMFAFTNGQPGSCFTHESISWLQEMGAAKLFAASGRLNADQHDFVLDRISMGPGISSKDQFWFFLRHATFKNMVKKRYW